MLMEIFYTACFVFICWLLRRRRRKQLPSPPELPGKLPLIGHTHIVYGDSKHGYEITKYIAMESIRQGGVITLSVGFYNLYAVADPDDCITVANACLRKPYYYNFSRSWLGNSLIIAPVPVWKKHRKLLSPAFNQQFLNGFISIFNRQSRRLVDQLYAKAGKGYFEQERYLITSNCETIFMTAIGITPDKYSSLRKEYLVAMDHIQNIFTERFLKFWLHNDFIFNRSRLKKKQDELVKVLHHMSNTAVQQRKLKMIRNLSKTEDKNEQSENTKSFIDLILELRNKTGESMITDREIREEIDNIISAGHDTSSFTMTYILILIGSYPEIQQRAFEELQGLFGNSDRDVDKDDVSKLVYLESVIKEAIRLYPIAPVVARNVDTELRLKNYTIQTGSICLLLYWGLHRHPVWGPDADQFKPERWLNPASLPDNPNAFAGFSLGKRGCIGKTYAMMSMKITIVHILRRYRIIADVTKLQLKLDVLLKPVSGHHISLENRT